MVAPKPGTLIGAWMLKRAVLEVEVKLRLADPATARRDLLGLGATAHPPRLELDIFFVHPQRDFASTREVLRLRSCNGSFELTYKGPPTGVGVARARTEHNVATGSDPTALLLGLGFRLGPQVTKQREPFELLGAHVTLDHLPGVGWFAEVEAVGTDEAAARELVGRVIQNLGWVDWPREPRSYLEMSLKLV